VKLNGVRYDGDAGKGDGRWLIHHISRTRRMSGVAPLLLIDMPCGSPLERDRGKE